jgi:hypothetical protein
VMFITGIPGLRPPQITSPAKRTEAGEGRGGR